MAESNHTARRLAPLGVIFLAVGLSSAFVGPFLSLFLSTAVHAGPVRVATFLVVVPLAAVFVSTLVGRLSDRRPIRRELLVAAATAGCASSLLTTFIRDYWALLAVATTVTAAASSAVPQSFAYARDVVRGSPRAALTISTLRMVFSIAWVAGPPVAAVLLAAGGFRALYGVSAVLNGAGAVVALVWLRPSTVPAGNDTAAPKGRLRPHVFVTVAGFVMLVSTGTLGVQSMSLFVTRDLHAPVRDTGLILGLCAAIEIPLMLGFGALATRFPLHRLVLLGTGFGFAYYALAALATHSWQLAAAQVLNACFISTVAGLGVSYMQDLVPDRPGQATTLFTNAYPVGAMLAGPLLGLAQHFGYRLSYALAAGLCVGGCTLLVAAGRLRRRAGDVVVLPQPVEHRVVQVATGVDTGGEGP